MDDFKKAILRVVEESGPATSTQVRKALEEKGYSLVPTLLWTITDLWALEHDGYLLRTDLPVSERSKYGSWYLYSLTEKGKDAINNQA